MQRNCLLGFYRGGISPHILGVTADGDPYLLQNGLHVSGDMPFIFAPFDRANLGF